MLLKKNKIQVKKLNLFYTDKQALFDINMDMPEKSVLAFIGPSGCGKSTFLKTINRMNDLIDNVVIQGQVLIDGVDIYHPKTDVVNLRKNVGMVFQRPNPFPMSIYDNVIYGAKIHKKYSRQE